MVLCSCITIAYITAGASIVSFLLVDPLADIMIIDRAVRYSKYNKPLFPII
jgi:hypothetical protein